MCSRRFVVLLFLLISLCLHADLNDFYYSWSQFFFPLIDENAGLTIFPSLFIPMGGKNEGMGTAFTAVASDISFIEANPAASSVLTNTELAFLHHSWIMDSNLEAIIYTQRWGNLGFGASTKLLYIPFIEKDDWGESQAAGYYLEGICTVNVSYNLFPNYYFHGLAFGLNLKLAYMGFPENIVAGQSILAGLVDFGFLTRFNFLKFYTAHDFNFSIGAVLKNLPLTPTPEPVPTTATFGIAYSPLRPLLLALDFNLPLSLFAGVPSERFYFATGLSVSFSEFVGLQAGIKIKGGNPMISLGTTIDLPSVSFVVNYNLDLTNSLDPLDKFSLAACLKLGDDGRAERRKQVEALYLDGLSLYAEKKIPEAIAKWQEALWLDPSFTPAATYLEIATTALRLDREIYERQAPQP